MNLSTTQLSKVPAWVRWPVFAAFGILVLTLVQELGQNETSRLTATSTSQAMLRWCVPILLAGLGGLFSERAGVINIGLEGMMILGMWFGAWGAFNYGPYWGLLIGAIGGAIGGLLHAIATVGFGVDHIISGVAINILAPFAARFLSSEIFTQYQGGSITQSPRVESAGELTLPFLAGGWGTPNLFKAMRNTDIPWLSDIGSVLLGLTTRISWATLIALALVPISTWILWKTRFGLRVRISGEDPWAGESQGINIYWYKYLAVTIGGGLAGLGGAFITTELSGIYQEGGSSGRGFIGLAALIFGNWRPSGILAGSLIFGYPFGLGLRDLDGFASHALLLVNAIALTGVAIWAIRNRRTSDGVIALTLATASAFWYFYSDTVPDWWVNILPYAIVIIVLIFFAQRLRMPAANGQIYR
ncbi:MAG: ABC transporter permease, partial [Acidimicrobiales bacterium]